MTSLHAPLLELQQVDHQIDEAEVRLQEFAQRTTGIEAPLVALEAEIAAARERHEKLQKDLRRLEHGATQKRERLRVFEERAQRMKNRHDESAARAELDLVRRAMAADDDEARELAEQATRADLRIDELVRNRDRLDTELQAQRDALAAERAEAETALELLRQQRHNLAIRVDRPTLRLYERVRSGRTRLALAPLTDEGACGACYNLLPVQEQAVIRQGESLHRCEACGVILYAA